MEKSTAKLFGLIDKDVLLKIGLGVAVAAAVGGAFYAMSRPDEEKNQGQPKSFGPGSNLEASSNLRTSGNQQAGGQHGFGHHVQASPVALNNDSVLTQMAHTIAEESSLYSMKTVMMINEQVEDLCIEDYGAMISRFRAERRAARKQDPARYAAIVEQEVVETDQLIMEALYTLLGKLGGDVETYKNSSEYWAQRDQRFAMVSMMWIEKMKMGIKTTRDRTKLTNEIAKDMMRFQLEMYPQIEVEGPDPELELLIKKATLQDLVFEKFGFEEEDLVVLPNLGQDMEFVRLTQGLQMAIQMDQMKAFGGMGMGF